MMALRLFIVALVKLACIAGFVELALHGLAGWAWLLLPLALLTAFPPAPSAPEAKPAAAVPVPVPLSMKSAA